jgi:hypothetical protein
MLTNITAMSAEKTARIASESARLTPIIDTSQFALAKGPVLLGPFPTQFSVKLSHLV